MKNYDLIVVGFGKAGKTLAAKFAKLGKKVALIEQNPQMWGGTCINIGCIPTKTLLMAAEKNLTFAEIMAQKNTVVERLRGKNFENLNAAAEIFAGRARFLADKIIEVSLGEMAENSSEKIQMTAENVIINTGAVSVVPQIDGISTAKNVFDSTGIQNLETLPKNLAIIGGGNIGLEFAGLYSKMGSRVTVFENFSKILGADESEIAELAQKYLEEGGVEIKLSAQIEGVSNSGEKVILRANGEDFEFDAVLYAVGRKPATENLGLENTLIELGTRGEILTDEFCQTAAKGVFAVGDVNGGPQFTYVSLDDSRIVADFLLGKGEYSKEKRGVIPTVIFLNPPLARVGLTEVQAREKGFEIKTKILPVAAMPRAHVDGDLRGAFKVVIDAENNQILGASLLGKESAELINLVALAMNSKIPAQNLARQIFTHPTMAENFNDLFDI